jgi:hypothetical protein
MKDIMDTPENTTQEPEAVYSKHLGKNIPIDDAIEIDGIGWITQTVFDEDFFQCSHDGKYYLIDNYNSMELPTGDIINADNLQAAGYAYCTHYGTLHLTQDMIEFNGQMYSKRFRDNHLAYCENCGDYYITGNPCCPDDDDDSDPRVNDYPVCNLLTLIILTALTSYTLINLNGHSALILVPVTISVIFICMNLSE